MSGTKSSLRNSVPRCGASLECATWNVSSTNNQHQCHLAITAQSMPTQLMTDPEHIAITKSKGIEIDWKDGHHSSYGTDYLRDWCPCASCTGAHGTEPRPKSSANPPA